MTAEPAPRPDLRVVGCPDCERHRVALQAARVDLANAEADLTVKRRQNTELKNELAEKYHTDPLHGVAEQCWEFWKAKVKPKARKMSDRQLKALLRVLKAKLPGSDEPAYPPRYICEAIVGAAADHYVDAKGKHHNGLELICGQLEDFHERYERHKEKACPV